MSYIGTNRSRKWQLTINNPAENDISHETIKESIGKHNFIYFCLCDEIGEQGTPHTHIYVVFKNAVAFETLKKNFPTAHIEAARGKAQQNRDYIRKEGEYLNSEKKETNIIETFEEFGEIPLDTMTKNTTVSEEVYQMIADGYSTKDILSLHPSYMSKISHIDRTRQIINADKFSNTWRNIEVTYIHGKTATGKTRYVMENFGYSNVCKIVNYSHPFDNYKGEDVILFDEFRSSLQIKDMLQYLDGYPILLPARYEDKVACFTKVFIVSNIPLNCQYKNIQIDEPETWNAFIRRIDKIKKFIRNAALPFTPTDSDVIQVDEKPSVYAITTKY